MDLADPVCHDVPSMHAWRTYINMAESKIGKITYVSWRNKLQYGWHDSYLMGIDGAGLSDRTDRYELSGCKVEKKHSQWQSRLSQGDLFYKLFLGDVCMNSACEKQCKYKYGHSSADLRMGDLWGPTYKDNQKGAVRLLHLPKKGNSLLKVCKE